MSIIFFDTETTGLAPGQVCQLAYVILGSGGSVSGKNFYFTVDYMPAAAAEIHGLTTSRLAELSEGRRFGDDADEIYTDFAEADLIAAHNFPFDFQFMSAEMARAGRTFHYKNSLCTMRRLTPVMKLLRSDGRNYKYPRLAEMRDYLGITAGDILSLGERLYGETGGFHDARYDAMVVFSAFMRLQETMTDISDMIIKAVNE